MHEETDEEDERVLEVFLAKDETPQLTLRAVFFLERARLNLDILFLG